MIFGPVAAVGAGLQVAVDAVVEPNRVSAFTAGFAVAVPVAIYLIAIGVLHRRGRPWGEVTTLVGAATAVLTSSWHLGDGKTTLCGAEARGRWEVVLQARYGSRLCRECETIRRKCWRLGDGTATLCGITRPQVVTA